MKVLQATLLKRDKGDDDGSGGSSTASEASDEKEPGEGVETQTTHAIHHVKVSRDGIEIWVMRPLRNEDGHTMERRDIFDMAIPI